MWHFIALRESMVFFQDLLIFISTKIYSGQMLVWESGNHIEESRGKERRLCEILPLDASQCVHTLYYNPQCSALQVLIQVNTCICIFSICCTQSLNGLVTPLDDFGISPSQHSIHPYVNVALRCSNGHAPAGPLWVYHLYRWVLYATGTHNIVNLGVKQKAGTYIK